MVESTSTRDLADGGRLFRASDLLRRPLVVAGLLLVFLLALGEAVSPGFATPGQIIKLLTIAAFRSSSNSSSSFLLSSSRAISTILTAPSTILCLAATIAVAC